MAETTIVLGDWNSDVPAAPAGSDNIAFAVDRTAATPKFSASIPRATDAHHGTVILDATADPDKYLGGDGAWHDLSEGVSGLPAGGTAGQVLTVISESPYSADWDDLPATPTPQTLSIVDGHVALDASLGIYFTINTGSPASDFTLDNPTNPTAGKAILIRITGAGTITLGNKYNARGATLTRSTGRDMLGIIYDAADEMWDCWWSQDA
jgi:hypothetical protein